MQRASFPQTNSPKGETFNTVYIKKALARFLVVFKKRPIISSQDWCLHLNKAWSIPKNQSRNFWPLKVSRQSSTLPSMLDLAPKVKLELAGLSLFLEPSR
jgi:hypothetical protein